MIYEILTIIGFISTLLLLWTLIHKHNEIILTEKQLIESKKSIEDLHLRINDTVKKYEKLQYDYYQLEKNYVILSTRSEENEKGYEEKIRLVEDTKNQLKLQFEQLATQIFEQKTKNFDEVHTQGINLLLKPFREQIEQFSQQSHQQFIHELKERQSLKDEILRLKSLNERLSEDAINLTSALKGENKTQGNWGEIVLERILQDSGLREGHEYEIQNTLADIEGKKFRPDVIVHLPQNKDIVIDSKVSLLAYDAYIRSETEEEKIRALKQHLLSIHTHIKGLSQKRYEDLIGVRTLDFVLLFMPIEGAFLLALEEDNEFFKTAYEQNIIVVSPSTLLVTLRTIEHIWRSEFQERNAKEIATSAEALYEKLVSFVEDMDKVGESIIRTQKSYDSAINKLSTGKGNLIRRAEQMRKLGLKPKKSMPELLLDRDEDLH